MNQWRNKHEVLRDLAEMSDYGPQCSLNLNPVTDKPPIHATEDTDLDDIANYFGLSDIKNTSSGGYGKPDLHCITQMIDMVREVEDLPDYNKENGQQKQSQPTHIVISKLNPNVKDFVPKVIAMSTDAHSSNISSPSSSNTKTDYDLIGKKNEELVNIAEKKVETVDINKIIDVSKVETPSKEVIEPKVFAPVLQLAPPTYKRKLAHNGDKKEETVDTNKIFDVTKNEKLFHNFDKKVETLNLNKRIYVSKNEEVVHNDDEKVETLDINKRIDVSKLDPKEAEILANNIKAQIDKIPAATSFECRFLKNAALSSLMKVYSVASAPPPQEGSMKLLTPDFFIKNKDEDKIVSKDPNESVPDLVQATECDITADEIKASIQKVKNWQDTLHKIPVEKEEEIVKLAEKVETPVEVIEPKVSKPVVQLAPPTYKRKEKAAKSPHNTLTTDSSGSTSRSSVSSQPVSSPTVSKQYVPTKRATELYEKLTKNAEMTQKPKVESIWEQLERKMKEKDIELKKKTTQYV